MRLFIAINFTPQIKQSLCDTMQRLALYTQKGNFTLPENLHLTLAFLGEVPPNRLEAVKAAMNQVNAQAFPLCLQGVGRFVRQGGDILWVGIQKNNALLQLNRQLCASLAQAGFVLESREFRPHLTLAREVVLQPTFVQKDFEQTMPVMNMQVEAFHLMLSERVKGKLTYTELYRRELSL